MARTHDRRRWLRDALILLSTLAFLSIGRTQPIQAQPCANCGPCTDCQSSGSCGGCQPPSVPSMQAPGGDAIPQVEGQPTPADPMAAPSDLTSPAPDSQTGDVDLSGPSATAGSLASSFGGGAGAAGVPSMIGDFFSGSYSYAFLDPRGEGTTVAVAGGDRQFKFAENNSPFPQDRAFFNYHHFHNAVTDVRGQDRNLDRYVFGLEKTFLNGWTSLEARVPFANSVSSNPEAFTGDDLDAFEFGNLAFAAKTLIARGRCSALSAGLGLVVPTGEDYVITGDVPNNVFTNETVYLQPFLGYYHTTGRSFSQVFVQYNFTVSGSDVVFDTTSAELETQDLLMLDYSLGHWVMRRRCAKYVTGLAPMIELHYTTTTEDQDYGPFRGQGIFVEDNRRDILNITGGLFIELGNWSSLKVGAVAPLRDGRDKVFDSEIGVQFTRRF